MLRDSKNRKKRQMRACGEARERPAETILETVGLTPTVRLRRVAEGAPAAIYGKIERFSPSGSVKYRIVPHIVKMAEQPSSGGTSSQG